ncbi:MAG: DUF1501 domain-containing protein [Candidatus Binatia bacterium]
MAITRRQFITRTGLAAAGSFFGPSLFRNPWLSQALAATIGDRYFVVVFLNGGNDGLNTVAPIANGGSGSLRTVYQQVRHTGSGGLQLSASELAATAIGSDPNTATPLALHPGLIGLKNLYDVGKVAVIQGCGYPDYNLSHDVSRRAWQTALSASSTSGWLGRYLAANYGATDIPGVTVTNEIAKEFQQTTTSVLAIRRLNRFGFPHDPIDAGDIPAKDAAFSALHQAAGSSLQATLSFVGNAGAATLTATQSYPALDQDYKNDRPSYNQQYSDLGTGFARDIREVAKVIYGVKRGVPNVNARFFEVQNGGYDTHSNQGGGSASSRHYKLHREVGDALELFYDDLNDMGVADKLAIVVWSEFSRRVAQNDNGTDHGSQGPMFVIGGAVNGGVYGNHPNINSAALNNDGNTHYSQAAGDPYRSTDFRDVYGTLLKHWLNMPQSTILSTVLALDTLDPASYWTVPNFDLGFV